MTHYDAMPQDLCWSTTYYSKMFQAGYRVQQCSLCKSTKQPQVTCLSLSFTTSTAALTVRLTMNVHLERTLNFVICSVHQKL
jgi:hypothetical protein